MTAVAAVIRLLGGPDTFGQEPHSAVELVDQLREGLPFRAYEALVAYLSGLPDDMVSAALGVPARTLNRRKLSGRLAPGESERVVRVARVVLQAEETLGGSDRARGWLVKPNRALSGRAPLALLDTDVGGRQVEVVLGRIADGVVG
jgi:putative toxin-antitoxin system antitoxin component (TIGR02293 family)